MAEHRTDRLKIYGDGAEVEKLINDRWRITVRCEPSNKVEDWYYANRGNTFADFASEMDDEILVGGVSQGWVAPSGQPWLNAKLIRHELGYTPTGDYVVTFIYETLTSSWVSSEGDRIGSTENGLRTLTRTQVAASGATKPYDEDDVGVSTITDGGKTLYLAGFEDQSDERMGTFVSRWAEPGLISTSTRPGRVDGTTEVTHVSQGVADVPTGVVIASQDTNVGGFTQFTRTAVQGTIEGVKQTYKDVVEVEVPGTVICTTVSVSSGGVSGNIAVPRVTPRRRKRVVSTVTVEVTSTPPDTATLAYDLGAISCSVTTTNASLTRGPGSTVSAGTNAVVTATGYTQNFSASARIQVFPGCYLASSSSSGSISYITSSQPVVGNNIITYDDTNSSRETQCIGTGSTSATGYQETGIIKRSSRPILEDLAGNTYYEVITWEV